METLTIGYAKYDNSETKLVYSKLFFKQYVKISVCVINILKFSLVVSAICAQGVIARSSIKGG